LDFPRINGSISLQFLQTYGLSDRTRLLDGRIWWRWRESNPRPKMLNLKHTTCLSSDLKSRHSQLPEAGFLSNQPD